MNPSSRIPGPRARLPLVHLLAMRRDLLGFLLKMRRVHGAFVDVRVAGRRTILVSDPPAIEKVLVTDAAQFGKSRILKLAGAVLGNGLLTSEGADHRRQRRMIQPVFYPRHLASYAATISQAAADFSSRWTDGQALDMSREMMRLALIIVGQALFGADIRDEDVKRIGAALSITRQAFSRSLLPGAAFISKLPLPANRRYKVAKAELDSVIYRLIRGARETRGPENEGGALLWRLLRVRDETGDGQHMSDQLVHDQAMTLLLAGHETTASALTWAWAMLSENPKVEKKLHAELDTALAGRPATFDDLDRLPYTRQIITETMRLWPPAYTVARTALRDYTLGPYRIRAGSQIVMSQFVVHRDERFFADPLRFDPDRWTPEFHASLPRFAYFPFGGGPRTCIGEGFAWTEGIIILATLAQHWRAKLTTGQTLTPEAMITLRARGGMQVAVERRR